MFKSFIALLSLCMSLTITSNSHAVLLNAGDIYTFEFSSMAFDRSTISSDGISGTLSIGSEQICGESGLCLYQSSYDEGDSFQINWFEDSTSDNPFRTETRYGRTLSPGASLAFLFSYTFVDESLWDDWQGVVTIEALSGSFIVDALTISKALDGEIYTAQEPIPVPPAAWLFATGMVGLIRLRRQM